MKNSNSISKKVGFIFTSVLGTFLHFAYDLSGQKLIIAPFSAVNESTWEHIKILFFPMFIFALIESRFTSGSNKNFWCTKLYGILLGLILIPILFYTYTGIIGMSISWVNIAIFYISAAAAYLLESSLQNNKSFSSNSPRRAFLIICLIALLFIIFTFIPPHIALFEDPITMTYGI